MIRIGVGILIFFPNIWPFLSLVMGKYCLFVVFHNLKSEVGNMIQYALDLIMNFIMIIR